MLCNKHLRKDKGKQAKRRKDPRKQRIGLITSDQELTPVNKEVNIQPKSQPTISLPERPERIGLSTRINRKVEPKAQHRLELRNEHSSKTKEDFHETAQLHQNKPPELVKDEQNIVKTNRSRCASLDLKAPRITAKKRSLDNVVGEITNHSTSNERRSRPLDFEAQNAKLKVNSQERYFKGKSCKAEQTLPAFNDGRKGDGGS